MSKIVRALSRKVISFLGLSPIKTIEKTSTKYFDTSRNILIEEYLQKHLYDNARYVGNNKLNRFEFNIFSQNGEDGIIEEIFNRIGTKDKFFVEFGVHGARNNTTLLLTKSWEGLWIEGTKAGFDKVKRKFHKEIQSSRLKLDHAFITAANIESLFSRNDVPEKFDFISIDIDGNDFWVWEAIVNYKPRVIQIEFNATLRDSLSIAMKYNEDHVWNGTSYFGASLKALEILGKKKGYALVGCDFSGTNAFFVSTEEDLSKFESPFTAENHYEPPRYFLQRENGHTMDFGEFETIA